MIPTRKNPRILIATPELSFLPGSMGPASQKVAARAGGLGDVAATLVQSLTDLDADVHVAIPNYRSIFRANPGPFLGDDFSRWSYEMPHERLHLVQDRSFFHLPRLDAGNGRENIRVSLAFQREVINRILPMVQPDLVHCLDWMTALLPAMARAHGIPCLYTLYSLESVRLTLAAIEEHGIDAASFWQKCYFERMPQSYEETRAGNPVDLLASAVFSAHFVSTPSPALSRMIADDACDFIDPVLKKELRNKLRAGCLAAVEHAPPVHFDPSTDRALWHLYGASDHAAAKAVNKVNLQRMLRLREDARAPLFLWPTRLDPGRRGCRLMAEATPALMSRYERQGLQVVFVADGGLGDHFRALAGSLGCGDRVAVCDFNPRLCRRAHAAADFLLVPMQADPCGLAWRIGHRYGTLPIGYDPGGIRDALAHLETDRDRGNGFVFRHFDTCGLEWAVAQAIGFYGLPDSVRARQITRIMAESRRRSDDQDTARGYIELYERVLRRPFGALRGGSRPAEGAGLKAAA